MSGQRARANRLNELRPAPGDLRLLQAFINTADLEAGSDQLANLGGLAAWLERHEQLPAEPELEGPDVGRAIEVRESFRKLLAAGESATREQGAAVDRALVSALLRARFEAGGVLTFRPAATGLGGAFGRLLAIIAEAQRDGLWPRLKICASGTCRAAFYDYSTNRSGAWCLPRCGSRLRGREFRRRNKQWSY